MGKSNATNTREKKFLLIAISIILIIAFVTSTVIFSVYYFSKYSKNPEITARAENIILMIGDGMGEKHIEVASLYEGAPLTINSSLPEYGYVKTRSLTPGPTDSAASATAMATGKKVWNRTVSMFNGKPLETITELAQKAGKKTGLVTTKSVTDATPAAFSAHVKHRKNQSEIALQQIENSNLNVLFGLGQEYYAPYSTKIANDTRDYFTSFSQLSSASKESVFCILPDDGISTISNSEETLRVLTEKALDILSKDNPNGFFLMVEGAKIDTMSHDNNMQGMINELMAFDDAVVTGLHFARTNKNTTVIVLADHETARIRIPADAEANDISDKWFKSSIHTMRDVPYFAFGPGASEIPDEIDNTDVFLIMKQLFNIP